MILSRLSRCRGCRVVEWAQQGQSSSTGPACPIEQSSSGLLTQFHHLDFVCLVSCNYSTLSAWSLICILLALSRMEFALLSND